MITYTFSPEELALCQQYAQQRQNPKQRVGIATRKIDATSNDMTTHLRGVMGEYACAQYLGTTMIQLPGVTVRKGGYSLIAPSGLTVRVRTANRRTGGFLLPTIDKTAMTADIGILVWPGLTDDSVDLVGFFHRQTWLDHCESVKLSDNYPDTLRLAAHWLSPLPLLRDITLQPLTAVAVSVVQQAPLF